MVGAALLMGLVAADLARRLGGVEAGETRPGFGAYRRGTRWILFLWITLIGALSLSAGAVWLLG
ncbi:MAG: hypothetical protein JOZ90_07400 [Alphaproteobacteria bacterium]|nr:hypothetical protein [Alphaproteobacteria bacterium]MBV9372743.1 hypothetical protein [Alphaproteobacteria bacterium]MBV9900908.1 hypothetical protein [Alphaproteobacteria bacterium]